MQPLPGAPHPTIARRIAANPEFRTDFGSCSVVDISPPLVVDGISALSLQLNIVFGN